MGMPGTLHGDGWRWRLDNGGEGTGGAGWHESPETAHDFPTGELDVNVRLRYSYHVEAGDQDDQVPQLQYDLNSTGTFANVNASSSVARSSASANFAEGDDTTDHGVTVVAGTFHGDNDCMDEDDGAAGGAVNDLSSTGDNYVIAEFCFQLREADLADNDAIEFRVTNAGTAFNSYPSPHANCTIDLSAGGDVFHENRVDAIDKGQKPLTSSGLGGVLNE